mmetsp:Transcript_32867/g.78687  ORF Transcript_32867/g.78687 Transcript_32867/m.78687 type:complete len:224 (+) Transcript_32867:525-1196(+)
MSVSRLMSTSCKRPFSMPSSVSRWMLSLTRGFKRPLVFCFMENTFSLPRSSLFNRSFMGSNFTLARDRRSRTSQSSTTTVSVPCSTRMLNDSWYTALEFSPVWTHSRPAVMRTQTLLLALPPVNKASCTTIMSSKSSNLSTPVFLRHLLMHPQSRMRQFRHFQSPQMAQIPTRAPPIISMEPPSMKPPKPKTERINRPIIMMQRIGKKQRWLKWKNARAQNRT